MQWLIVCIQCLFVSHIYSWQPPITQYWINTANTSTVYTWRALVLVIVIILIIFLNLKTKCSKKVHFYYWKARLCQNLFWRIAGCLTCTSCLDLAFDFQIFSYPAKQRNWILSVMPATALYCTRPITASFIGSEEPDFSPHLSKLQIT